MTVASTSKKAYKSIKDLSDKQRTVHQVLGELGIASNQDVADKLGWTINRVTGRMKELRDFGFVEVHGTKVNQFGNSVKTWHITDPFAQKKIDQIKPKYEAVSWLYDNDRSY